MEFWQYFGPLAAGSALVAQVVVLAVSWAKTTEGTKSAAGAAKDAKAIALEAHAKIDAAAALASLYRENAVREFANKDNINDVTAELRRLSERIDRALERNTPARHHT